MHLGNKFHLTNHLLSHDYRIIIFIKSLNQRTKKVVDLQSRHLTGNESLLGVVYMEEIPGYQPHAPQACSTLVLPYAKQTHVGIDLIIPIIG